MEDGYRTNKPCFSNEAGASLNDSRDFGGSKRALKKDLNLKVLCELYVFRTELDLNSLCSSFVFPVAAFQVEVGLSSLYSSFVCPAGLSAR